MLVTDPVAVLSILLLAVALAVWLGPLPYLRSLGGALLAILFGAALANLGIIPTHEEMPRLYDPIFWLLAGTLGTASGTYAGFAVGAALGSLFI